MNGYSLKSHGAHLMQLLRHGFVRALFVAYAFLVFLGVMPKPPQRTAFMDTHEYLLLTLGSSLGGLLIIALALIAGLVVWSGIAAARTSKNAAPRIPEQTDNGGPL